MRRLRDILRLKFESGHSHRAIARACSVGVGTVSEYVGRAKRAGLTWPLPAELDDAALEAKLFPLRPESESRRPLPDVAHIHQERFWQTGVRVGEEAPRHATLDGLLATTDYGYRFVRNTLSIRGSKG